MKQRKYSRSVQAWAKKVKVSAQTVTKVLAFKLIGRIKELTPVDTGRLKASWNLIPGEHADLSVAPKGKGKNSVPDPGIPFVRNANAYTISNNLKYVRYIEEGTSKQAAVGMVKIAVAEVRAEAMTKLG